MKYYLALLVALIMFPNLADVQAQEKSLPLNQVTEDVVGILVADLEKIESMPIATLMKESGYFSVSEMDQWKQLIAAEKDQLKKMRQAGINRIYALLRPSDLTNGPTIVAPVADENQNGAVRPLMDFINKFSLTSGDSKIGAQRNSVHKTSGLLMVRSDGSEWPRPIKGVKRSSQTDLSDFKIDGRRKFGTRVVWK